MKTFGLAAALVVAATLVGASPAMAQAQKKQRQRLSPHETITAVVDGSDVKLVYGRPYTKKPGTDEVRKIWGGLVPYDKVWRTGADEATLLTTTQADRDRRPDAPGRHLLALHIPRGRRLGEADRQQEDRAVGHPLRREEGSGTTSWRGSTSRRRPSISPWTSSPWPSKRARRAAA